MVEVSPPPTLRLRPEDRPCPTRFLQSALAQADQHDVPADLRRWFADPSRATFSEVEPCPLEGLAGWVHDPVAGVLGHRSGRFFTVEGLDVQVPDGPVRQWRQPIINQPEVGILGLLAKEFDGVLHFLTQAKAEPGNCNGLQVSPTVQATRSNYTQVHGGRSVPYLEYFTNSSQYRVLADVRQSEQGSAFKQKRNRNIVVETTEEVEERDGFRWLTLGQIHQLLGRDDLVNMDLRTVLSCLPVTGVEVGAEAEWDSDRLPATVIRSCEQRHGAQHTLHDILGWITELRSRLLVRSRTVPLHEVTGWHWRDGRIAHESGRFFSVIGVDVRAGGREVDRWMQPMFAPHGTGVLALLVRRIAGVLHVLVHARVEAGYVDVIELAPTVQCTLENYDYLPASARPVFLDEVLSADPGRVRYDVTLSEEGGRFFHARNRYMIIEADPGADLAHPDYRWVTLHQLGELLRHSHYVNVQARSLVACLYSLVGR
jgi:oxidase EvaA